MPIVPRIYERGVYHVKALMCAILTAAALTLSMPQASGAIGTGFNGIYVYGCTSDGKPVRVRVRAPIKDKAAIDSAFRQAVRGRSSEWFDAQKRALNGEEWQRAVADVERLSGGKLPKQNAAVVARTIRVGKSDVSRKRYCGG